jgi:hypothetical protein
VEPSVDPITIVTALSPLGVGTFVLAYRWMRLRLVRHIYDEGGADDAVRVIKAMKVLGLRRPGHRFEG